MRMLELYTNGSLKDRETPFCWLPRVVKKPGLPVTAARLMVWKREWAAISADAERAQFQARASAGQDVRLLGR